MASTDKRVKLRVDYATGTSTQYIRGDGGLSDFNTSAINAVLTGLSPNNSTVAATDSLLVAVGKLQGQVSTKQNALANTDALSEGTTNLYFTAARSVGSLLTGFSVGSNTAMVATDSVVAAFGKTQGQLNNRQTVGTSNTGINTTVAVNSLAASASTTDVDLAITPKGAGALLAQTPDGTTVGGNKRGTNSVDLQTNRSANTQVASGNFSAVNGGQNNTASGVQSSVSGGTSNVAGGTQSSVSGGGFNSASGTYSCIIGGSGNFASGSGSTAMGLQSNARYYGSVVHNGSGVFSSAGDCQRVHVSVKGTTANATETTLYLDGAATGSSTNRLVVNPNTTWYISGNLVARSATGSSKVFTIKESSVSRAASLASVTLGTVTVVGQDPIMGSTGTPATWLASLGVDTTTGSLTVKVTGDAAATTVRWYGYLNITEVSY
jgi:hypothetical protein